jgi:AraC-like DNA-binding protein
MDLKAARGPFPTTSDVLKSAGSEVVAFGQQHMHKQTYFPRNAGSHNTSAIAPSSIQATDGELVQRGRYLSRYQIRHEETFSLLALEARRPDPEVIYTQQGRYIKFNFWVGGAHTTVLNGYGQCDHLKPEILVTACPDDQLKMDIFRAEHLMTCAALCILPSFFETELGVDPDELPEPLRSIVKRSSKAFVFEQIGFTPALLAASRAIIAAPFAVRRHPIYARAKAQELMCLLIDMLSTRNGEDLSAQRAWSRHKLKLYEARDILVDNFAQDLTLARLARAVGLNRFTLTSGFRKLFSCSVHDFVQKLRMERAYELLLEDELPITRVADMVGYVHSCNFSTAFRSFYGYSPKQIRARSSQLRRGPAAEISVVSAGRPDILSKRPRARA